MREEIQIFPFGEFTHLPFYFEMVGISYCDDSYRIIRDNSLIYCLEYVIEGKGIVIENNHMFEAEAGDVYFLKKGANQHYYCAKNEKWVKIWFNMNGRLIDNLLKAYELEDTVLIKQLDLSRFFYEIIALSQQKPVRYRELFEHAGLVVHQMLMLIYNSQFKLTKGNTLPFEIKRYLESSLEENINMSTVSNMFYCSVSQLNRVFKQEFHVTPYDYLLHLRLDVSKHLLKHTNMKVKEISDKLQFADEHYFSSFFKKKIGMTPSQFRKENKQEHMVNINLLTTHNK